jgi:hypothetical protein
MKTIQLSLFDESNIDPVRETKEKVEEIKRIIQDEKGTNINKREAGLLLDGLAAISRAIRSERADEARTLRARVSTWYNELE